jgi:hypothetical protein
MFLFQCFTLLFELLLFISSKSAQSIIRTDSGLQVKLQGGVIKVNTTNELLLIVLLRKTLYLR